MDHIAVLIPCYNEALTVEKVISDWKKSLPEAIIYVYDNNSTDGTDELARKAGAIVRYEHLQGKGNVVRRMFQEIDAECYILVDGDDTYPAEDGFAMTKEVLENGVDMVVGDRLSSTYFSENKRLFHNFGNTLVKKTINLVFHSDIKDIMTGYRALSYRFAKSFPVLSKGFEIETEMTIFATDKNMLVKNHVITYRDRPAGSESKLNTYSDGVKVMLTILKLFGDYKPMVFFGIISLMLSALSLIFFIPVLAEFMRTGLVSRFPTLITCGFVFIAAIVLLCLGILLQNIKRENRRAFEFRLHEIEKWKTT